MLKPPSTFWEAAAAEVCMNFSASRRSSKKIKLAAEVCKVAEWNPRFVIKQA